MAKKKRKKKKTKKELEEIRYDTCVLERTKAPRGRYKQVNYLSIDGEEITETLDKRTYVAWGKPKRLTMRYRPGEREVRPVEDE